MSKYDINTHALFAMTAQPRIQEWPKSTERVDGRWIQRDYDKGKSIPSIVWASEVTQNDLYVQKLLNDGTHGSARIHRNGFSIWDRFKAAWLVFTGKADALLWDG